MEVIKITDENIQEVFDRAYNNSFYTMMGCAGELSEWINGMTDLLSQYEIGTPKYFIAFTGKDMNDYYELTGTNAYSDELLCLMFPLDKLNVSKLAIFKLRMGDRWFDDIVDNDRRRQMGM